MVDRSNRLSRGHLLRVLSMIALSAVLALLAHSPRAAARLRGPSPQVVTPGDVPRLDIELSAKDFEKLSAELARRGALGGVRGKEDRSQRVKARGTARGDGPRVAVRVELLEEWSERLEGGRGRVSSLPTSAGVRHRRASLHPRRGPTTRPISIW